MFRASCTRGRHRRRVEGFRQLSHALGLLYLGSSILPAPIHDFYDHVLVKLHESRTCTWWICCGWLFQTPISQFAYKVQACNGSYCTTLSNALAVTPLAAGAALSQTG